jgi:hypothetical protein
MLLEKNFNISKSNTSLKAFLDGVHEFKNNQQDMTAWAAALDLNTWRRLIARGRPWSFCRNFSVNDQTKSAVIWANLSEVPKIELICVLLRAL